MYSSTNKICGIGKGLCLRLLKPKFGNNMWCLKKTKVKIITDLLYQKCYPIFVRPCFPNFIIYKIQNNYSYLERNPSPRRPPPSIHMGNIAFKIICLQKIVPNQS